MKDTKTMKEIIKERYSCRTYQEKNIEINDQEKIKEFISTAIPGPFGNKARFKLVTAREDDSMALKGLGTYGFIKNPAAFIVGAIEKGDNDLEDYGYHMEKIILHATGLDIGTCWLGGSFKKSNFSKRISASRSELVPAVTSLGYSTRKPSMTDTVLRAAAGAKKRKPWEDLFFYQDFSTSLRPEEAGNYENALEMVRLAPSASNVQPWRIVKDQNRNIFHLYLQRSLTYKINLKLMRLADLQRVDMGIAMCHFELTAAEEGLKGRWEAADPGIKNIPGNTEYIVTWIGE